MDSTGKIILIGSLFIIMMGMGLSLRGTDFKRVLKMPIAVLVGFLSQIVLLPLIAFVLNKIFGIRAEIALGLMVLAACPGGPTSNLVTHLAKGDTALSVTLTAINSLITIVTIPLIVNFGIKEYLTTTVAIGAPVNEIAGALVVVIALPLTIGMLLKKYASSFADKMDKPVRIVSALVLVLVIAGLSVKYINVLGSYIEESWAVVLTLNVVTMFFAYLLAKLFGLNFKQAITISLESGNQNGTLALTVAAIIVTNIKTIDGANLDIPAIVFSLLMYITAIPMILLGNRMAKKVA